MATYYVSPTGNDGNPGSEVSPWRTIPFACTQIADGDTVIVEDGTYTDFPIEISNNNITLAARNRCGVNLDGGYVNENGIQFTGGSGQTIDGLEIQRFTEAGGSVCGIELFNGGANATIQNCEIHDIGNDGTSGVSTGQNAIFVEVDGVTIQGCYIHDIGRTGPVELRNHDHGVYIDGSGTLNGIVVRNNFFKNILSGWGLQIFPGTVQNADIYNNTFVYGNPTRDYSNIVMTDVIVTNVDIHDNVFWDGASGPSTRPIWIYDSSSLTCTNVTIRNNRTTGSAIVNDTVPSGMTLTGNVTSSGDAQPTDPAPCGGGGSGWTPHTSPLSGGIGYFVCWSPELERFVMVGQISTGDVTIQYSDDGQTWTQATSPFDGGTGSSAGYGVCWAAGLGLFVAVGRDLSTPTVIVATSPDGVVWTPQTTPWDGTAFALGGNVAWSESQTLLVLVGWDGAADVILTSPDAITWTPQTSALTFGVGVAYSPDLDLWVAGGNGNTGAETIVTSPDGTTWTPRTSPFDDPGFVYAVGWAATQGLFVAVGDSSSRIATSPDGVVWTDSGQVVMSGIGSAVQAGQGLILVGSIGGGGAASSEDGITWEAMSVTLDVEVWAFAYSDTLSTWVGVGTDGAEVTGTVMTSAPVVPPPPAPETQYQRIYGWTVNISDDALETIDPVLVSPEG